MKRRRAFTLIEILTVIAILAILIGLVAYGMSKVIGHSKVAATKVTLQNLKSLISEFETTTRGLTRQPGYMYALDGTKLTTGYDLWRDTNLADNVTGNNPPNLPEPDPAFAPADVTKGTVGSTNNDRFGTDTKNAAQLLNTQLAFTILQQAPNNKKAIAQFPASQLIEAVPAGVNTSLILDNATSRRPTPPLVLDAWGNPILFVPAGGLCGQSNQANDAHAMWIGGKPGDADARAIVPIDKATGNQLPPITSPDKRPFWASAGPDGNFCTADDNIYSFEE